MGWLSNKWRWEQDHLDSLGRKCWSYYPAQDEYDFSFFATVIDMGHGMFLWEVGWAGQPPAGISPAIKRGTAWASWTAQLKCMWAYRCMLNEKVTYGHP